MALDSTQSQASPPEKGAFFEKVRNGRGRVLIGSAQKMGTGTNVQKRLAALHHLDAPWKPAEIEQRNGRILRQSTRTRKWRSTASLTAEAGNVRPRPAEYARQSQ